MIINISISGDRELIARLKSMPASVHAALLAKVQALALKLEGHIKRNKLSGQVLNRKSGRLMRSINSKTTQTPDSVFGVVFQSADVPYGAIHEFGGQTRAHLIVPKKAAILRFIKGGDKVFATRVNHPGSKMPERSYMRSGLRDMSEEISKGIKQAVLREVQGKTEGGAA